MFIITSRDLSTILGMQKGIAELGPTSQMTWESQMTPDMTLAEKVCVGVCVLIGGKCCTVIPNNTAPDGTISKA
jgi:hypothetical protein